MPTIALSSQYFRRLRNFRPGDRIRNEGNLPRAAALVRQSLESHHQLHILDDGVMQITARLEHRFALKESEGAGDDDVATKSVPAKSAKEERAQILDDLNAGQQVRRYRRLLDAPMLHQRAVDDANRPSGRNDIGGVKKWTHHALQTVGFDEGVGVHRAHQLAASEAQTNVQRIGLASILLVDDDQARISRRAIQRSNQLRLDVSLVDRLHRNEIELLDEDLDGPILRPVANDDHFETGVVQRQQRAQTRFDCRLLVVSRGQNRDRWR